MREITKQNVEFRVEDLSGDTGEKVVLRAEPKTTAEQFRRQDRPDADPEGIIMGEGSTEREAMKEIEMHIDMLYSNEVDVYNNVQDVGDVENVAIVSSSESDNMNIINKIYEQLSNKGYGVTYLSNHQSNVYEVLNYTLQHRHNDTVVFNQNKFGVDVNLLKPVVEDLSESEKLMYSQLVRKVVHINSEVDISNSDDEALYYSIKKVIGNENPLKDLINMSDVMKRFVQKQPDHFIDNLFRGYNKIEIDDIGHHYNMLIGKDKRNRFVQEFLILSLLHTNVSENHTLVVQGIPDLVLRSDYSSELLESDMNVIFSADPRFDRSKINEFDIDNVINL